MRFDLSPQAPEPTTQGAADYAAEREAERAVLGSMTPKVGTSGGGGQTPLSAGKYSGSSGVTHGTSQLPHRLLAGSPAAAADYDGLPTDHLEYGLAGEQSVARVQRQEAKFQAWVSKHRQDLHVGDDDTPTELKDKVLRLLYCYRDVFAENPSAPSEIQGVQHHIGLLVADPDVTPVKIPLRRCSPRELEAMFRETETMLKNGTVQPSTSPWAAQVVMVPKPRDPLKGLRYAVDYRALNRVSKSDCGVLPRIDDLLDSLAESEVFSMVDAAAGFWGCAVKPEHRQLTAFNTAADRIALFGRHMHPRKHRQPRQRPGTSSQTPER